MVYDLIDGLRAELVAALGDNDSTMADRIKAEIRLYTAVASVLESLSTDTINTLSDTVEGLMA